MSKLYNIGLTRKWRPVVTKHYSIVVLNQSMLKNNYLHEPFTHILMNLAGEMT